jgi:hypothetical protein
MLILEYPRPVPTTAIAERVSYRYDPAVYRADPDRAPGRHTGTITVPDAQSRYRRPTRPPVTAFSPLQVQYEYGQLPARGPGTETEES